MDTLLDYEGLIYSIINKYPRRFDYDDLYQVGMIGLIDAYKHYDESYETKFSSFAYYYIIGEINKYIRESSSLKVSRSLIELKNLRCYHGSNGCYIPWVYYTSFWTGSVNSVYGGIFIVKADRTFWPYYYYDAYDYGVRPVIVVPKSQINS